MLPLCLQQSVSRKGATRWVLACGVALLGACASPPEMAYPTGQGRQPLNKPLAAPLPDASLAYDAPEIQRLSEALNQLQEQINEAQSGGRPFAAKRIQVSARVPIGGTDSTGSKAANTSANTTALAAVPPASATPAASTSEAKAVTTPTVKGVIQVLPAPDSKVFGLEPADTTLIGVLLRWAGQMGWLMRLNGVAVDGHRFPRHAVAYADVALERGTHAQTAVPKATVPTETPTTLPTDQVVPGSDALASAVARLMQAHSHYQYELTVAVGFNLDKGELEVSSQALAPPAGAGSSAKAAATTPLK